MGKKCNYFAGETRWRGRDPEIGERQKSSHPDPATHQATANKSVISIKTNRTTEPSAAQIVEV